VVVVDEVTVFVDEDDCAEEVEEVVTLVMVVVVVVVVTVRELPARELLFDL
jgi:hypothetical protein